MTEPLSIAVGQDNRTFWHEHFIEALQKKKAEGYPCRYSVVNMEAHDWLEQIMPHDIVLWRPTYMGVKSASYIKEKIYFLQHIAQKIMIPNFETIWHFESKIAQSYLFKHLGVRTPDTFVSFDYHDASQYLASTGMPLVVKKSEGSHSQNVRLAANKVQLRGELKDIFCEQLWMESKKKESTSKLVFRAKNLFRRWGRSKMINTLLGKHDELSGVYWQQFISGNEADLRITVIGDCFAFGFWRHNRRDDFRASGSGLIDYEKPVPESPMRYCLKISKDLDFDSMCYDILFTKDDFVLLEMSYGFIDRAVYNAAGHFVLEDGGDLTYREGHVWPEELWVEWALKRVDQRKGLH